MLIDPYKKIALFQAAKTASRTTKYILCSNGWKMRHPETAGMEKHHKVVWYDWLKDYKIYVSLRDPRSRLISCWQHLTTGHTKLLQDYIKELPLNPTTWHVDNQLSVEYALLKGHIDGVIRQEYLNNDLSILLDKEIVAPYIHKTSHLPWRCYNIEKAKWWWGPDLKEFGHLL